MAGQFPCATKTFTVIRDVVVNKQAATQTISSSESIALKDTQGYLDDMQGGTVFTGMYQGTTFADTPIQINDTLVDNEETDADGKSIKYKVTGKSIFLFYSKLHLTRSKIG